MVKYEDIKLTPGDAFDLYVGKYPNTTVKEVELELDSNSYVYKVEGYDDVKEYKVYVHPVEGYITQIKEKLFRGKHKEITKDSTGKIQEIVDKALKDAGPNSEFYEWTLEIEDRILELAIRMKLADGTNVRYKYNLDTGALVNKK